MVSSLFFILSKIVGVLFRPETLLVLFCLLALRSLHKGNLGAVRRYLLANAVTIVAIAIYPVGNFVLNPLERTYPAEPELGDVEGILLLGGGEYGGTLNGRGKPQLNQAGDRFLATLELARRFPEATVIFAGGSASLVPAKSGARNIGSEILLSGGLEPTRLVIEGTSRNTTENAVFSRKLAPEALSGQWVVVTSGYHMPRSIGTFCAVGWSNLVPWPVDHRAKRMWRPEFAFNLYDLNDGLREWVGLLAYQVTGKLADPKNTGCLGNAAG